jgi:hypothetical protein
MNAELFDRPVSRRTRFSRISMRRDFNVWIEESEQQTTKRNWSMRMSGEKKGNIEFVDQDPKAGAYFIGYEKMQKIHDREFGANATRRQPVRE